MEDGRKKVLFILPSLAAGGAEKISVQLVNNIDRSKFIIGLVLFERKGEFLKDVSLNTHIYNLGKKNRYSFPWLVFKLAKIIRNTSPSILISSIVYANFVVLLARAISLRKIPVIITEHSVPHIAMKSQRMHPVRYCLYHFLYPKADRIIAVSKGLKNELSARCKIHSEKVRVIYNGVDVEDIRRLAKETVKLHCSDSIPRIIAVGRLITTKGYAYLLKAVKRVRQSRPVHLFVLGKGERRKELEELARELGIRDSVSFMGFQENPYKYIANADLFVLSSVRESFGIVLVEAMACGVPVVATRCPYGPGEIITDEENGLLISVGDIDALVNAILRLLKDKPLRERFVEAGRKKAEDFQIEKMVVGYENVFEEMINR